MCAMHFTKQDRDLREKSSTDIGFTIQNPQKLFIAESLTRKNRSLFEESLKKKKELNYKFLWTKYGKIVLRKDVNSPVLSVKSMKDLEKLH